MIPENVYKKYNLADMSEYESETDFYLTFLAQTDHIPNKIIESLLENMASATITNFVIIFIDFIKAVRIEYKEVLEGRKFAREQINTLEEASEGVENES